MSSADKPPGAPFDAAQSLAAVGEAAYDWRIDTDVLSWGNNAAEVLLVRDPAAISTGRVYAQILDAENAQARHDAVMQSGKHDDGRRRRLSDSIWYPARSRARDTIVGRGYRPLVRGRGWQAARALGVIRVINERYEHERQLTFLARYDGLTGELNRHRLTEVLEDTIEEALRFRSSCGFLLVAIDHLSRINESYGFDVADEVIRVVAKRLRARMRGKDTLGRISGNKFGLVLRDCTPDDMAIAADRMLHERPRRHGADRGRADRGDGDYRRRHRAASCPQRRRKRCPARRTASKPPRARRRGSFERRTGPVSSAKPCGAKMCAPPTRSLPRSMSGASFSPTKPWPRPPIASPHSMSA